MRVSIKAADGRSKHWVARTSRGLNKKQRREIAAFRKEVANVK